MYGTEQALSFVEGRCFELVKGVGSGLRKFFLQSNLFRVATYIPPRDITLPKNPIHLVISGIDGSGKTTIIEALSKRLSSEGFKVLYVWLRYNHILVKPVHALCRLIGLSRQHNSLQGKVWRHEFHRCQVFCSFYIALTWIDSWLGRYSLAWRTIRSNPDIVLCDRWVNDILVDLAVDCRRDGLLDSGYLARFQQIVPKDAKAFLIVRKPEAILHCRPEYRDDPDFAFRIRMYRKLQHKPDAPTVICNDNSIDDSVSLIMSYLKM